EIDQPVVPTERAIVFFDGVCGLCNSTVDFIFLHDKQQKLACAPLQGETATALLPAEIREELNTLVLQQSDGRRYIRSAAVVRILWALGGPWKLTAIGLWLIPLPLRNLGYRLVARWRYRLFGERQTCRMPTPEDADRLLP
ncbi:MAG: thiol-disulfide oxidoreductase DCC family protein, partial [Planctomycetaceae bacterium]